MRVWAISLHKAWAGGWPEEGKGMEGGTKDGFGNFLQHPGPASR